MKNIARKLLNSSLGFLGYNVVDDKVVPNHLFFLEKYQLALTELRDLYALIFKQNLPENEKRIDLLSELWGTNPSEAFYILYQLNKIMESDGDICEFGVAQGSTSALMANEILNTNKNIWLFDSFKGLPMPTEKDILKDDIFNLGSMNAYAGTMSNGLNMVTERIRRIGFPFERVKIVPGFIEETIKRDNLPSKVIFAYVDFDFYEPIKIALHFLDKVLVEGGCIVVDDYDWFSTGAKTAVDEFMVETQGRYALKIPDIKFGHFCVIVNTCVTR